MVIIAVLLAIPDYLQQWLWMRQLDYVEVFWTLLSVRWGMFLVGFMIAFLFLWLNIRQAIRRAAPLSSSFQANNAAERFLGPWQVRNPIRPDPRNVFEWLQPAAVGFSAIVAFVFGSILSANWDAFLRFRYGGAYGLRDPLFGVDIGFYLFHLPFYQLMQRSVIYLALITLLSVGIVYFVLGLLRIDLHRRRDPGRDVNRHLLLLVFGVVALAGWGFYLDRYSLVYSTLGIVYGAGYAADHVTRNALLVMEVASAAACALLLFSVFRPQVKIVVAGAAIYVSVYLIGIVLLPVIVESYFVQPNELSLETPYLNDYIAFTRKAYGLDAITETSYPALADLTPAAISRNQDTIQNIRLWDARPLLQTYRQSQAIRTYYDFYNVDTDRYRLADGYHQVMLSTRELSPELPPEAQTWVNKRLQFTHGYGGVMNFVSKTDEGGTPQYVLENIPTQSDYGLSISQPSIYFGKSMPGYRIVGTGVKEFDYPKGNDNVYTSYAGTGGILLDSLWKRLLFAWTQGDVNILLTSYVKPESRIQIWRRVRERVSHVAPFLRLDHDPYPVLSDGKLYWIQDAYTDSSYFPYSRPLQAVRQRSVGLRGFGGPTGGMSQSDGRAGIIRAGFTDNLNYIRNSVKVVVDMYDGTVRFYVMDPTDPVLSVYRRAFPGAFSDLGDLSNNLRRHLRYPTDMFAIQADQYRLFHMTDPQVFYNQEDLWQSPKESYEGGSHQMRPYYVLMKLPGSSKLEYLLMTPFTPQNRSNMISWMAATCDYPDYGKMVVFRLPKEKLIYGPNQVEAMIDQNTDISRQITLWDQRGSRVIRGKQIVTPIDKSFLYVVPLYLTATDVPIPELKRVIVAADGKVAMAATLDAALADLFMPQQPRAVPAQGAGTTSTKSAAEPTLEQARLMLDRARKALQQGDWEAFGKAMDTLEQQLTGVTN